MLNNTISILLLPGGGVPVGGGGKHTDDDRQQRAFQCAHVRVSLKGQKDIARKDQHRQQIRQAVPPLVCDHAPPAQVNARGYQKHHDKFQLYQVYQHRIPLLISAPAPPAGANGKGPPHKAGDLFSSASIDVTGLRITGRARSSGTGCAARSGWQWYPQRSERRDSGSNSC